jgi:hypothetical protein
MSSVPTRSRDWRRAVARKDCDGGDRRKTGTTTALPVRLGIQARPVAMFTLKNCTLSPVVRARVGAGWQPPPHLILAVWHDTPAMLKILRLAEHIEWAAKHDALNSVGKFLREMREEDWFHIGD